MSADEYEPRLSKPDPALDSVREEGKVRGPASGSDSSDDSDGYEPPEEGEEFRFSPPPMDGRVFHFMEKEWNKQCELDPSAYPYDFPPRDLPQEEDPRALGEKGFWYQLGILLRVVDRDPVEMKPLRVVHHVENRRERRKFIVDLAQAFLKLAAPSHQIIKQLDVAARALDIGVEVVHIPTLIMLTLGDGHDAPKQTRFIRENGKIALSPLEQVHTTVRLVSHDEISCVRGSEMLKDIMRSKPIYNTWERCLLSFLSASIICGTAFGGSPIDLGLGGLCSATLTFASLRGKETVLDNVFEITMAMLVSFVARGLSSIRGTIFCYSAISSSGIVSILPGFMILTSALELFSQNLLCGSSRLVYALIYSFILAFSLTIGSDFYFLLDSAARRLYDHVNPPIINYAHIALTALNGTWANQTVGGTLAIVNSTVDASQDHIIEGCYRAPNWPWWRQPLPWWTVFFLVPLYLALSSLQNLHNWRRKIDWYITRVTFATTAGAITIGLLGNVYSRVFGGSAFTSMVTGVVFLVPSAIANTGGLSQTYVNDVAQYQTGFNLALHMLQVAIGVTIGLSFSQFIVYAFGSKKRTAHFAF
ncbi:hypothetical protein HWV62_45621 [Athelia sp. TMB]|nr:hypothetical protein HWV62_45621 [Athelia sp. TMB]